MKQICLTVPKVVYDRARAKAEAKKGRRKDGLKLLPTAVLREWLISGMEKDGYFVCQ